MELTLFLDFQFPHFFQFRIAFKLIRDFSKSIEKLRVKTLKSEIYNRSDLLRTMEKQTKIVIRHFKCFYIDRK